MFGATYLTNLIRARISGQAVPLGAGLVVNPDGSVGTPGGGYRTPSPAPVAGTTSAQQPMVMNQANPAFTAGIPGLAGSPSGNVPTGAPTPAPSVTPSLSTQAQAYRQRNNMGGTGLGFTTDQLNQMSLQAAQQGRTWWNPAMNVQPGGNVVNALTTPPGAGTMVGNALVPGNASGAGGTLTQGTDQQLAQLNTYQQWLAQQQQLASMYGGGGP